MNTIQRLGHISELVALCEKLKSSGPNYFSKIGQSRLFRNFPQCPFCHFWGIIGHFRGVRVGTQCAFVAQNMPGDFLTLEEKNYWHIKNELMTVTFVKLIFRNFVWNDDVKNLFCIVGTNRKGISYLTFLNPQLFKIIHMLGGSFCSTFFVCILQLDQVYR